MEYYSAIIKHTLLITYNDPDEYQKHCVDQSKPDTSLCTAWFSLYFVLEQGRLGYTDGRTAFAYGCGEGIAGKACDRALWNDGHVPDHNWHGWFM